MYIGSIKKLEQMEQEITKLYMNDMTQQKMYKIFGLRKVFQMDILDNWLSDLPILNDTEQLISQFYQKRLLENIHTWNEHELLLGFIGPILNLINFQIPYKINFFAQRTLTEQIGEYELIGKPDGMLASGYYEPETPFFAFQEYKKDLNSSGDPIGQNLAAMLVGQAKNGGEAPIYGCYVVGRLWYFMVLKGKEFAISKSFSADNEDIFEIVKALKGLRDILFEKINQSVEK